MAVPKPAGGKRPDSRPSIAFIATNPGMPRLLTGSGPDVVGGAEVQLRMLAHGLADAGYSVSFGVGGYEGVQDAVTDEGIRMTVLYSMRNGTRRATTKLLRPFQMIAGLRRMPTDVVISMGAGAQAGVLAAWCRLTKRRYIFWLASDTDAVCHIDGMSRVAPRDRWLALRGLRWADTIVAQTRKQADAIREHHERDAVVVPNIWPHAIEMADEADDPYALWVSNIRPEKRPEMLIEIARELPEIRFVMIGGSVDGYRELYDTIREDAELLSNVDFRGYVPFEETQPWFTGARLLVNTSAVEGFPNTYLQAWAAGKPVVASFDPDAILAEQGIGRVFGDTMEGIVTLRSLWFDREKREDMGSRAASYMSRVHGTTQVMSRARELLGSK